MHKQLRFRHAGLASILVVLMLLITSYSTPTPSSFADESTGADDLPADALDLGSDTFPEIQTTKSQDPKLDSALVDLMAQAGTSLQDATTAAEQRGLRVVDNRVQVEITTHAAGIDNAKQAVVDTGGEVTSTGFEDTYMQAWLPLDALNLVAAHEDILMIRRPAEVQAMQEPAAGLYTSEGVAVTNADAWHTAGYTGDGVKIAVIDFGFLGYTNLIGSDLPTGSKLFIGNFVDFETNADLEGFSEHGTACAEIIYDMAPDATIYLIKIETILDLDEAVSALIAEDVDIISSSIGWYNVTPGDGSGIFNDIVSTARENGILWVTAAGNDRENHWGGLYADSDNDGYHNFSGSHEINVFVEPLGAGRAIRVFLRWDDWVDVTQDYDIYLVRWNGSRWQTIAQSIDYQNGRSGQTPTENLYAVTYGATTYYGFYIVPFRASRRVNFEVFAPKQPDLNDIVTSRSLANLADAQAAMTVAALDVDYPYPQESYSSEGPANGPGGAASGGLIKPDISAFANVATFSYGTISGSKFNGTSSATPHVAGAAALVKGAFSSSSPTQVQTFLENRALDRGSPGMDTQFGHGQLNLGLPPGITSVPFDFDGNGTGDILWRNPTTGDNVFWINGAEIGSGDTRSVNDVAVGVGDFNADGRADILWRNSVTGGTTICFMNGSTVAAQRYMGRVNNPAWKVVGVDDFNGDGYADILWRNENRHQNYLWLIRNGVIFDQGYIRNIRSTWKVAGTGDFDGNGFDDILWRNSASGRNYLWLMNSSLVPNVVQLQRISDQDWRVVATNDLNGDGTDDILWQNIGNGLVTVWNRAWLMNSGNIAAKGYVATNPGWRVVHTSDFNGDLTADILWRNTNTGENYAWFMNGFQILAETSLRPIDLSWGIVGEGTYNGELVPVVTTANATTQQSGSSPNDPDSGETSPPPNEGVDSGNPPPAPESDDTDATPPETEPIDDLTIPPPETDENTQEGAYLTGPDTREIFLPLIQN